MKLPGLRTIIEVGILGMDRSNDARISEIEDAIAALNAANTRWFQQKQMLMMRGQLSCPAIDTNIAQNNAQINQLQQELEVLCGE